MRGTFKPCSGSPLVPAMLALLAPSAAAPGRPSRAASQNTVVPALIVTQAGRELASFDSPVAGTISVVAQRRRAEGARHRRSRSPDRTQLVQQPNGAIQLYFPNAQGVGRMTSTDDGADLDRPDPDAIAHDVGPVDGATVLPDGTPFFTQDGTGFVNVFRGPQRRARRRTSSRAAAATTSRSRSTRPGSCRSPSTRMRTPTARRSSSRSAPTSTPATPTALKPVAQHEAPLVADHSGNTFLAWAPGYPTATGVSVVPFRGGSPAGDGVTFRGIVRRRQSRTWHSSVDSADRLWARLDAGTASVHAARSRSHGMHFGATVSVARPEPRTRCRRSDSPSSAGTADVVVNTGSSLVEQAFQPGLSVRVFKKTKKVGKKTVVTWWAQALDDGFGVAGAHLHRSAARHGECGRDRRADQCRAQARRQRRLQRRATSAPLSECPSRYHGRWP